MFFIFCWLFGADPHFLSWSSSSFFKGGGACWAYGACGTCAGGGGDGFCGGCLGLPSLWSFFKSLFLKCACSFASISNVLSFFLNLLCLRSLSILYRSDSLSCSIFFSKSLSNSSMPICLKFFWGLCELFCSSWYALVTSLLLWPRSWITLYSLEILSFSFSISS